MTNEIATPPTDEAALRALSSAAHRFSQLLQYFVRDNWMSDEDAKNEALAGLNECVKAMGDIEGLF